MSAVWLLALSPKPRATPRAVAVVCVMMVVSGAAPAKSSSQILTNEAMFSHDVRTVFSVVLGVFAHRKMALSLVSKERGLVRTGSIELPQSRLRQLVPREFEAVVDRLGRQGGRFVLEVAVSSAEHKQTRAAVRSMIVMRLSGSLSPAGGQIIPSNGALEAEFLAAVTKALASR